jgi:Uma2 family endonuclease
VATATKITTAPQNAAIVYPTSDGRPMGETDLHRSIMFDAIASLKQYYAGQRVYVSGNILLFYQPGNRRRHVSPDVLVVKGIEPHDRLHYLLWEEGRPPHVVIEVTSESTREEDLYDKFEVYRDRIRVPEYFLFDPTGDYLEPSLQGYRLKTRRYEPIKPAAGRLPSRELGLHLEVHQEQLKFYDPATNAWIPTLEDARDAALAARQQAEAACQQAEALRQQAEAARQQAEAARQQAEAASREAEAQRQRAEAKSQASEAEADRLRQELAALRRQLGR